MQLFIKILLAIDLIILLVFIYETFFVSSNRDMTSINLALVACIGLGWWLRLSHSYWALVLAGLPAAIVLIIFISMIVSASGGNWR